MLQTQPYYYERKDNKRDWKKEREETNENKQNNKKFLHDVVHGIRVCRPLAMRAIERKRQIYPKQ